MSHTITCKYTIKNEDFSEDLNVYQIVLSDAGTLRSIDGLDANTDLPPLCFTQEDLDYLFPMYCNLAQMNNVYVDGTIPSRNDQLQEQYRLQEEWLRVQRTEEYARQKLQQDYAHALKMKEQAEKERFQAFFILQEKDAALQ